MMQWMNRKKVSDLIPLSSGIFSHMDYTFPDGYDKSQMDIAFIMLCGDRTIAPFVKYIQSDLSVPLTSESLSQLSSIILMQYKKKWDRLIALTEEEYDPLYNYSDKMQESVLDNTSKIDETAYGKTESGQLSRLKNGSILDGGSEGRSSSETVSNTGTDTIETSDTITYGKVNTTAGSEALQHGLTQNDSKTETTTYGKVDTSSASQTTSYGKVDSNISEQSITYGKHDLSTNVSTTSYGKTDEQTQSNQESGQNVTNSGINGFNSAVAVDSTVNQTNLTHSTALTNSNVSGGSDTVAGRNETSLSGTDATSVSGSNTLSGSDSVNKSETDTLSGSDAVATSGTSSFTGTDTTTTSNTSTLSGQDAKSITETKTLNDSQSITKTETITGGLSKTEQSSVSSSTSTAFGGKDTETGSEARTISRSYNRIGNIGNIPTQQLFREEIELWKWNLLTQIIDDVKDYITVPIYL